MPLEISLANLPEYTLYGDGQLIWVDYEGSSFPTTALPALRTTVLSDEQIHALLESASQAGILDNNIDYGTPNITDVGGTTVAINVDGVQHSTSAYALGFDDESLTDEQVNARVRLAGFIDDVSDAAEQSADAISVFVFDFQPRQRRQRRPAGDRLAVRGSGLDPGERHHRHAVLHPDRRRGRSGRRAGRGRKLHHAVGLQRWAVPPRVSSGAARRERLRRPRLSWQSTSAFRCTRRGACALNR